MTTKNRIATDLRFGTKVSDSATNDTWALQYCSVLNTMRVETDFCRRQGRRHTRQPLKRDGTGPSRD